MNSRLHRSPVLLLPVLLWACTEPAPPADRPPQVLTVVATASQDGDQRVLAASVAARHESPLGFRTGGRVLVRRIEVGQRVAAGAVLGELDAADLALATRVAEDQQRAAEAELAQAQRDLARFGRLGAEGAMGSAEEERQRARSEAAAARLEAARHQVELAERRQGYASLRAPFAGVITQVQFEPGLSVAEGQAVLSLADPAELEVVAEVPADLQPGLAGALASASPPGQDAPRLALRLRELAPQANPAARTVRARFSLAAPLTPAMAGTIALGRAVDLHLATTAARAAPAQLLPAAAVAQAGSEPFVYRVDVANSILVKQAVQVLGYSPDTVQVSGVPEGSRVVAAGVQKLHEGMKVVPVERSTSGLDMQPVAVARP